MIAVLPVTAAVAQAQEQGVPQRPTAPLSVPITGAAPNTFVGDFNIQRFANQNGTLVAIGTLVGTLTDGATGTGSSVAAPVAIPVNTQATTATCEILNLVLGPLDLSLLGLQVHLDQVVLNITAVPGAGNLLGNLLCAIAGLLDGPGPLAGLAALHNNLLALLGSL